MKSIKTESVAEFLARGGEVKKVATKVHKPLTRKQRGYQKEVEVVTQVNISALPKSLKIRFGLRD